jgi:virginiamycin A acetyltransferase
MLFDKNTAQELYELKILLAHNSMAPTDTRYGWLDLPSEIKFSEPIRLEERVGIYGGAYHGSVGAPNYHGFCTMGSFSYSASALPQGLVIGRYCSIATGLTFLDSHHPVDLLSTSAMTFRPHNHLWMDLVKATGGNAVAEWDIYNHKKFPIIGNDVWIGRDVTLAMGVSISTGAVIAARSVVTKDVPPYAVVAGNPAEVKKIRFSDDLVLRLLNSRWWEKSPEYVAWVIGKKAHDQLAIIEGILKDAPLYKPRVVTLSTNGMVLG